MCRTLCKSTLTSTVKSTKDKGFPKPDLRWQWNWCWSPDFPVRPVPQWGWGGYWRSCVVWRHHRFWGSFAVTGWQLWSVWLALSWHQWPPQTLQCPCWSTAGQGRSATESRMCYIQDQSSYLALCSHYHLEQYASLTITSVFKLP